MAVKVTKGQICSGTISKIKCHKEYYLCGKFHTFFTNSTECLIFWTMPLYYLLAHTTFNASDGCMPVHTRIIHSD